MNSPRRLVVRGVNWLGDAIMAMPGLMRLREALPNTHIALLTADKLADLWTNHPAVNEVIRFKPSSGVGQASRIIRAGRYDASLILPNSFRSAFESWLAGVPVRVGYGRPILLTHSINPRKEHVPMRKKGAAEIRRLVQQLPPWERETFPSTAHHLYQYLRLATYFGASELASAPRIEIREPEASAFKRQFSIPAEKRLVGLNPGAEYGPAKRWPIERFAAAAREVARNADIQWLIFGGTGDKQTAGGLEVAITAWGGRAINLAGRTSLRELAAGLSVCEVVLTNDTGPMHLAAAVGTRVVAPFGSTSPELTGPGAPNDPRHTCIIGNVPCAPCFLRVCPIDFRCMHSISPERIAAALREALRRQT